MLSGWHLTTGLEEKNTSVERLRRLSRAIVGDSDIECSRRYLQCARNIGVLFSYFSLAEQSELNPTATSYGVNVFPFHYINFICVLKELELAVWMPNLLPFEYNIVNVVRAVDFAKDLGKISHRDSTHG